ncbi:phosphohistidine phosphatase SixA [Spirulina subsalsa FACHB-351]|uniref:Phosphohistidine phosphatase SixA n=1 Tax=Spirulina subsalsa FACHB-351 TaxID=234711 RepID=A0ABT3L8F4_9CYAN|nr:phosphohistidine phosphatase SixA [Spirulina subsalsa]MCW6037778.1 phosphohistidine phosphatase SixA [Spirulina subsalsa FACHB-351]
MDIYLIRHGIAGDRTLYRTDEERPLTDLGIKKTRKVAQRIQAVGIQFDLILTSPLLRAKQTAELLQQAGLSQQIQAFAPLAPEGNINLWVNWYGVNSHYQAIALVGHQPDLGNWAEQIVWGSQQEKLIVKKAGIIGVHLPSTGSPLGQGELFGLIPPKWFL